MTVRSTFALLLTMFIVVSGIPWTSAAQDVPDVLHYDGRLAVDGLPAEGTYEITFSLFSDAQGGQPIWSETHEINVEAGLFSALLGSVNPLLPAVSGEHESLYLAMQIGDDEAMAPRLRLASAAFALRSGVADSARDESIDTNALANAAVTTIKLAEGGVTTSKLADAAVTEGKLADGAVSRDKLAASAAVTSLNGRSGTVTIEAGSNVTVSEDDGEITISAADGGGGDITSVGAGEGLAGGGDRGDVTLRLQDGAVTESKLAEAAVTASKLANISVTNTKLANQAVTSSKLSDGAVTFSKLASGAAVTSLNNRSGPITLSAGDNIEISEEGSSIVISASGKIGQGGGDDNDDDITTGDGFATTAQGGSRPLALADLGVTTTKLADGAVTASKLADHSVTSAKLQPDVAVTSLNGLRNGVTLEGSSDIRVSSDGDTIEIDYVGPTIQSPSSRRWKSNIRPLQNATEHLMRLRGVSFEWTEDGRADIGVIAEEVGVVFPEVVTFEENGRDAVSVDYGKLVSVLIEAVKAQQEELNNRQAEIRSLTDRVERLERLVEQASAAGDLIPLSH